MEIDELKDLLEELHDKYNRLEFIEDDPICIPHRFTKKEDIEISGFLAAILAWGQRKQIIKSASYLLELMDNSPSDFVLNASPGEVKRIEKFYYRTFQPVDAVFVIHALRNIYKKGGLESLFQKSFVETGDIRFSLIHLYTSFCNVPHEQRSLKHIANVQKGSSAKRLNMYLRWMVRSDKRRVDFGLWKTIPASALYIPLDVHTGNSARTLNLLTRKQSDWKAVVELTNNLKKLDRLDPIKYDFSLFGAGIEGVLPR